MPLHRLRGITVGVPEPQVLNDFYQDLGFVGSELGWGPEGSPDQIAVAEAPYRQLMEIRVACHDEADLEAIRNRLDGLGVQHATEGGRLIAPDPVNKWRVIIEPAPVADVSPSPREILNIPGDRPRTGARPRIYTEESLRPPRRLGHVVIGTPDILKSHDFYIQGLGFRISDIVGGLGFFTRCSSDHHNLLLAPGPVPYLNHYAIERDDIDTVMKAASDYLRRNEGTQVAGPGRHMIGGNVFWYLRDPSGNFFEQFTDMDCIVDEEAWEIGEWGVEDSWSIWGEKDQPEVFFNPIDMQELIDGFNRDHG
ncbi:VOC family protein [Myxococcota bacterium]|nr:VOC family protein [Myxococcota bacterium]